jgi:hypothetical protein
MTTHTETHQLDTELTLRDSSQSPLSVYAITLTLTKQEDTLIESRLTFQVISSPVAPDLYGGRGIAISSRTLATNERKLNHGLSLALEVSADSDGIAQLPTHPMT